LLFFIDICDAFYLGNEGCSPCLPGKVKVWFMGKPRPRFNASLPQDLRQLVLGIGMSFQAAFHQCRIDCEWLPLTRDRADLGFSV
jgi:hypothetical protein